MTWLEVANWTCALLAIAGALILGTQGDKLYGWIVYLEAAILGVIYFAITGNAQQLVIWVVFLVNDVIAIRRKRKERTMKVKFELKQQ